MQPASWAPSKLDFALLASRHESKAFLATCRHCIDLITSFDRLELRCFENEHYEQHPDLLLILIKSYEEVSCLKVLYEIDISVDHEEGTYHLERAWRWSTQLFCFYWPTVNSIASEYKLMRAFLANLEITECLLPPWVQNPTELPAIGTGPDKSWKSPNGSSSITQFSWKKILCNAICFSGRINNFILADKGRMKYDSHLYHYANFLFSVWFIRWRATKISE